MSLRIFQGMCVSQIGGQWGVKFDKQEYVQLQQGLVRKEVETGHLPGVEQRGVGKLSSAGGCLGVSQQFPTGTDASVNFEQTHSVNCKKRKYVSSQFCIHFTCFKG